MITIITAIHSLRPGAEWGLNGRNYDGLNWFETNTQPKPTKEEVESEIARLQAEYDLTEYQRQRAPEYPDLREFVDAYYWAQKGDETKMNEYITKCDAVKDMYPKP